MALHRDSVAALLILLVAVAGWFDLRGVAAEAALFPQIILVGMGGLALVMFLGGLRQAAADRPFITHARNLATALGLTLLYILAVEPFGYFPSTLVFVAALAWSLGYRGPLAVGLAAVMFTAAVWLVFVGAFSRRLPPGLLFAD